MITKKLIAFLILLIPRISSAAIVRYVQISTNSITQQAGGINIASATISNTFGTVTDQSTTTHNGSHTFNGAVNISGAINDSSTNTWTGGNSFSSFTNFNGSMTVTGSTIAFNNSVASGTIISDVSTRTFKGGEFSGFRNDNSTITFIGSRFAGFLDDISTRTYQGGEISGFRNDNSSITYIGTRFSGVSTDISTRTFTVGVFNGTLIHNSTETYYTDTNHIGVTDLFTPSSAGGYAIYVTSTNSLSTSGIALGADNNLGTITTNGASASMQFLINGSTAGDINATTKAWNIKGTNTNDSASTGNYGEIISSVTASKNFPGSGTYGDLAQISLTAGDWMVSGSVGSTANGATVSFTVIGALSTSGDNPPTVGVCRIDNLPPTAVTDVTSAFSNCEFKLTATTTVYLKYRANYTVATPKATGVILGLRIR